MAERWYGGWDSGINSEIPSAAATKPPSCSGHESVKPACQSVIAYSAQQSYCNQQQQVASASSVQEMEFCQNTPISFQPQISHTEVVAKSEVAFGSTYNNQAASQQQSKDAPFTPPPAKLFAAPQRVTNEAVSEEDTAVQAIPKIIELLCDEDPIVVSHASLLVLQMSKSEKQRQVVINSQPMIEAIVATLSTSGDHEIVRNLTGTLHSLSQVKQGIKAICQFGGIPALMCVLSSVNCQVDHTTTNYALTMLHNALLQENEIGGVKAAARSSRGAAVLTKLLHNNNPKFLAILIDCIHVLCLGHSESKLAVVANGGPPQLVRILRSHTYEKLLWTVSRLVKVLSTCQQNKVAIIEAGGMHALTAQLSQPSSRLVMNCLWSLRNLSDAATKQTGLDHLMHFLLHVLSTVRDKDMVSCSIGVLSNLTCNNQHNKIVICNSHGIEVIFQLLSQLNMDQHTDIFEPAIFTLRHLTSRHPASEHAQATFRNVGGVIFIANLLNVPWSSIRPPIVKAACGLMRNLALIEANHPVLLESGCLHRLTDILVPAARELLGAAEAGVPAPKSHDGTRLDDLAEQAAGAVHAMVKDSACREAAKQTGLPQALIQLSTCKIVNDNTRKQAHGALTELASVGSSSQQGQQQSQQRNTPQQQQQQTTTGQERPSQTPSLQQYPPVSSQQGPPSVPPTSMTPMSYQQPQTPTRQQRPAQPQPPAQYQPQQQYSQEQPASQEQAQPNMPQAHSLPQSPYHPPRMMSTQPSVSVPPTPQQSQHHTQQRNATQQQAMALEEQQQQHQAPITPAHHNYQQQYSHMQAMHQQQQQQWYPEHPQHALMAPPQAHQIPHQYQHYAAQYAASSQSYGY